MIIAIITNFAIIFTFTALIFWIFSSIKQKKLINNRLLSVYTGIAFGLLSLTITWLFYDIGDAVLVNTRFITFLLGGMIGGPITMMITGIITFICRYAFGLMNGISLIFSLNSLIFNLLLSIIAYYKPITFKTIHYYFAFVLCEITLVLLIVKPFTSNLIFSVVLFVLYSIALFAFLISFFKRLQEMNLQALQSNSLEKIDFLTQLPNSLALENKIQSYINEKIPFELIHIDIDLFKNFNMKYSYHNGDQLLSQLAHTIRLYAESKKGFVARIASDEFCYVLKQSSPAEATIEGYQLSKLIEQTPYIIENEKVYITISASIVSYPETGKTLKEIYTNSHSALKVITETKTNTVKHINQIRQENTYY